MTSAGDTGRMFSPQQSKRYRKHPTLLGNVSMARTSFQLQEVKRVIVQQASLFKSQMSMRESQN